MGMVWWKLFFSYQSLCFICLLPNGEDVVKFWPTNYYDVNGLGGHIQIKYQTGFILEGDSTALLGDVNNDGVLNVVDVVQIVSYILNNEGLDSNQLEIADFNQDGNINVVDIVNLVTLILSD